MARQGVHRGALRRAAIVVATVSTLVACSTGSSRPDSGDAARSSAPPSGDAPGLEVTGAVATGLEVPWGLAFLPNGSALVSERDSARILRITPDGGVNQVGRLPAVVPRGEGGQLDLALSPDFKSDHLVYVYYTAAEDNRIVRMTYQGGELGEPRPVLTGIPKGVIHNGGRLAFGPDGMLYASTGNTGDGELSQDRSSLAGKVLRMTPDGGVPPDNPFGESLVYSYGHRNVEGLAFDSRGRLWASEFGQNTWDELNLIEPGGNYGWPIVEGRSEGERFIDPVWQWHTDVASPSGIEIVDDIVYLACLQGERVWQVPIAGNGVRQPRDFFTEKYGRLRSIIEAPDGSLWLTTSNRDGRGDPNPQDDKILRVEIRT